MGQAKTAMVSEEPGPEGLVIRYQQYAHSIAAKLIANMHLPAVLLEEFVSAGYLGLVEAAQRFDPNAGVDFKNYAFLRIKGAIIDSIRADSDLSGKAYRLAKAWQACQALEETFLLGGQRHQTKGDEESLAELFQFAASGALAFKLSMEDVEEEVADLICEDMSQEDNMIAREESSALRELVSKLPQKERLIIEAYYFQNKTFSQIEAENDGMTKSWISRLHSRALLQLRHLLIESGRTFCGGA